MTDLAPFLRGLRVRGPSFLFSSLRGYGLAALLVIAAAGCAPRIMRLPAPGAPAPDGAEVLDAATKACSGVRTLTAEVAVSGRASAQKMRGRLSVGVAAPASARIEAVAPFGAPVFIFVATQQDATLLLPRDGRVLEHGRPAAVLEAVSGVPLGPADLRAVLTGCPGAPAASIQTRSGGGDWRLIATEDEVLYVHRDGGQPWRLVAITHAGDRAWRVEYRDFRSDLPREIHLVVAPTGRGQGDVDLSLALSQVDVNAPLGSDVFRVDVPKGADPITVEELRRSGPLADRKASK